MPSLIPEQRRRALEDMLRASDGIVTLREAREVLGVSDMTVRRDVAELERSGVAVSVSGGLRLSGTHRPPAERRDRAQLELREKRAIARGAASLIRAGMSVFLDAGTTCEAIARELLGRRGLTIVTSDFSIATALMGARELEVIHCGGRIDAESGSSEGYYAARTVAEIRTDLCFLSSGAWDLRSGVTTTSEDKVMVKHAALAATARRVLVASSSKYGARDRFAVAELAVLDDVITDTGLGKDVRSELRRASIGLTEVEPARD